MPFYAFKTYCSTVMAADVSGIIFYFKGYFMGCLRACLGSIFECWYAFVLWYWDSSLSGLCLEEGFARQSNRWKQQQIYLKNFVPSLHTDKPVKSYMKRWLTGAGSGAVHKHRGGGRGSMQHLHPLHHHIWRVPGTVYWPLPSIAYGRVAL